MGLTRGLGAYDDGTPEEPGTGASPRDVRMALAGLFTGPGVVAGSGSSAALVTGTSGPGFAYSVGKAHFVTQLTEGDGVQLFANDGAVVVNTDATGATIPQAAPTSGMQRIDIVWVRHPTNAENGDTTSQPRFGVAVGVPNALPVAPTIPAGALELGRNTMTSGATSTASSGNTITQTATITSLRGGRNPYTSLTRSGPGSNATPANNTASLLTSYTSHESSMGDFRSTGVVTIPRSGRYFISAQGTWAPNGTGVRRMQITKNGTTDILASDQVKADANDGVSTHPSDIVTLEAGDNLRVMLFQNSGGALALAAASIPVRFTVEWQGYA